MDTEDQFDEWIAKLIDLNYEEEKLNQVRAKEAEAMEDYSRQSDSQGSKTLGDLIKEQLDNQ